MKNKVEPQNSFRQQEISSGEWISQNIKCLIDNSHLEENGLPEDKKSSRSAKIRNRVSMTTRSQLTIQPEASNAYGQLIFPSISGDRQNLPAEYVRISVETSNSKMIGLFKECWKVAPPTTIISVLGDDGRDVRLSDRAQYSVRRALTRMAIDSHSWLITKGVNQGVSKVVGHAISEYYSSKQADVKRIPVIGVCTWGCVHDNIFLESCTMEKKAALYYPQSAHPNPAVKSLEPNHSHFLLADDGSNHQPDREYAFRTRFVDAISKYEPPNGKTLRTTIQTSSKRQIPVVTIVIGGNLAVFHSILHNLSYHIPCAIVKGSGGAADFVDEILSKAGGKRFDEDDPNYNQLQDRFFHHLNSLPFYKKTKIMLSKEAMEEFKEDCLEIVANRDLIHSFQVGPTASTKEVEVGIMNALFAGKMDLVHRIQLALLLNREMPHESLSEGFEKLEHKKKQKLLRLAILQDRPNFIHAFQQQGLSLALLFPTSRDLTSLYRDTQCQGPLMNIVKQNANELNMLKIGKFLKAKIGSGLTFEYSDPKFSKTENPMELHERHLFLYNMMLAREASTEFFWIESSGGVGSALLACIYFKALAKDDIVDDDPQEQRRLLDLTTKYEERAICLLKFCHRDNEVRTIKLITYEQPLWGNSSAIEMAEKAGCKNFIAIDEVQNVLQWKWMGKMAADTNKLLIYFTIFCPFLMYFIKFDSDPEDTEPTPSQSQLKKEASKKDEAAGMPNTTEPTLSKKRQRVRWYRQPLQFYNAPLVKMFSYYTAYFAFILGFAYFLIFEYNDDTFYITDNIAELIVMIFVATLLVEELRQMFTASKDPVWRDVLTYLSSFWNWLDLLAICCFIPAAVFRFFMYSKTDPGTTNDSYIEITKTLYIISLILFIIRLLHCMSLSESIGPKLLMLSRMGKDITFLIVTMIVFMAAFGIGIQAFIYPTEDNLGDVVDSIVEQTYWPSFGNPYIVFEQIRNQNAQSLYEFIGIILLGIYMLLTNVFLFSLFVAMLVNTLNEVNKESDAFFKFARFKFQKEFYNKPPLPPPFSIFVIIYRTIAACCKMIVGSSERLTQREYNWERQCKKEMLSGLTEADMLPVPERLSNLEQRLDYMVTRVEGAGGQTEGSVLEQMASLQKSVGDLGILLSVLVTQSDPRGLMRHSKNRKALLNIQMRYEESDSDKDEAYSVTGSEHGSHHSSQVHSKEGSRIHTPSLKGADEEEVVEKKKHPDVRTGGWSGNSSGDDGGEWYAEPRGRKPRKGLRKFFRKGDDDDDDDDYDDNEDGQEEEQSKKSSIIGVFTGGKKKKPSTPDKKYKRRSSDLEKDEVTAVEVEQEEADIEKAESEVTGKESSSSKLPFAGHYAVPVQVMPFKDQKGDLIPMQAYPLVPYPFVDKPEPVSPTPVAARDLKHFEEAEVQTDTELASESEEVKEAAAAKFDPQMLEKFLEQQGEMQSQVTSRLQTAEEQLNSIVASLGGSQGENKELKEKLMALDMQVVTTLNAIAQENHVVREERLKREAEREAIERTRLEEAEKNRRIQEEIEKEREKRRQRRRSPARGSRGYGQMDLNMGAPIGMSSEDDQYRSRPVNSRGQVDAGIVSEESEMNLPKNMSYYSSDDSRRTRLSEYSQETRNQEFKPAYGINPLSPVSERDETQRSQRTQDDHSSQRSETLRGEGSSKMRQQPSTGEHSGQRYQPVVDSRSSRRSQPRRDEQSYQSIREDSSSMRSQPSRDTRSVEGYHPIRDDHYNKRSVPTRESFDNDRYQPIRDGRSSEKSAATLDEQANDRYQPMEDAHSIGRYQPIRDSRSSERSAPTPGEQANDRYLPIKDTHSTRIYQPIKDDRSSEISQPMRNDHANEQSSLHREDRSRITSQPFRADSSSSQKSPAVISEKSPAIREDQSNDQPPPIRDDQSSISSQSSKEDSSSRQKFQSLNGANNADVLDVQNTPTDQPKSLHLTQDSMQNEASHLLASAHSKEEIPSKSPSENVDNEYALSQISPASTPKEEEPAGEVMPSEVDAGDQQLKPVVS